MKVNWLIQSGINDEYLNELAKTIQREEMKCKIFGPDKDIKQIAKLFPRNACVIYHGSLNFAHALSPLRPYWSIWADNWSYDCTTYYPKLQNFLLNGHRYVMLPAGDLIRMRSLLVSSLSTDGKIFIRPNRGNKPFTGFVWNGTEDELDLNMRCIEPDTLVLASPACKIVREWRLICDLKSATAVAGSQYMYDGEMKVSIDVPSQVFSTAEKILPACIEFVRDPMITVDIAETLDDLKVLEINSFGAAGWYMSFIYDIVKCAQRVAMEEWREIWLVE